MSTRWESLIGDTSRFAVKLAFLEDTSDIPLAREFAASWGSVELWVRGTNLCAHVEEGETLDSVHWYLLPLLEWLVANWNPLLHEERLPVRNAGEDAVGSLYRTRFPAPGIARDHALQHEQEWYDWRQRHGLHAARDGGLFPEIFIRRWEDQVEVSWSNQAPPGSPKDFAFLVPHGRARLAPDEVAQPLFRVCRAAVDQLREWEPGSNRLEALAGAVTELAKPRKQRAARLDWLFSLDIEDADTSDTWSVVRRLFSNTTAKVRRAVLEPTGSGIVLRGSSHAVLLFGSVDPHVQRSDARQLAGLLVELFAEAGEPTELLELTDSIDIAVEGLPWEQGYELAEQVHQALGESAGSYVDVDTVLGALRVSTQSLALTDARLRGVAIAGPQHQPAAVHNESHPRNMSTEGRRFTLAHEFCHLLIDRRVGRKLAVASGPWAPIDVEKRANAFAAYFLMPPHLVQAQIAALAEPLGTPSGIRAVAHALGTSPRATLEHLYNLGWLDEFERDTLRGTGLDDDSFDRPLTEIGG